MKKYYIILILVFLVNQLDLIGQEFEKETDFNKLTVQVINQPELKGELLTDKYKNTESIFVQADRNYIDLGRETFKPSEKPPYYIWHPKTLFFYDIDFWLKPISVSITENTATYEFRTCSAEKQERTYYEGSIEFVRKNGNWEIIKKKIKKARNICLTFD